MTELSAIKMRVSSPFHKFVNRIRCLFLLLWLALQPFAAHSAVKTESKVVADNAAERTFSECSVQLDLEYVYNENFSASSALELCGNLFGVDFSAPAVISCGAAVRAVSAFASCG